MSSWYLSVSDAHTIDSNIAVHFVLSGYLHGISFVQLDCSDLAGIDSFEGDFIHPAGGRSPHRVCDHVHTRQIFTWHF